MVARLGATHCDSLRPIGTGSFWVQICKKIQMVKMDPKRTGPNGSLAGTKRTGPNGAKGGKYEHNTRNNKKLKR